MADRPGAIDFEQEIRGWHTEISRWNYGTGPKGDGAIGHFLQVSVSQLVDIGAKTRLAWRKAVVTPDTLFTHNDLPKQHWSKD